MTALVMWILGGFWRFVGAVILIGVTLDGLADIARAFKPLHRPAPGKAQSPDPTSAAEPSDG